MSDIKELIVYNQINIIRKSEPIVKDIDFILHDAEIVFLLGTSGSGKSSFLKSFYGALPVQGAEAKVLNFNLLKINKTELQILRRKLGLVFQDFKLFDRLTVYQNLDYFLRAIKYGNKEDRKQKIENIIRKVDLYNKLENKVFELSGGEKQRLSIARALIHEPKIILADEPTGNLDKKLATDIFTLLRDLALAQGSSVIASSHDNFLADQFSVRTYLCESNHVRQL